MYALPWLIGRIERDSQVISMPQVNLQHINLAVEERALVEDTYCKPIKLKVKRAMRMDSVLPLMEGVPTHEAA